jgi:prevent-host-death family protein
MVVRSSGHTSVTDARARFSELIKRVEAGEEVLITRRGVPVARIARVELTKERVFANDENLGFIPEDFNEPLTAG